MQNINHAGTANAAARSTKVRSLVMAALMGVLSFILMYFNFPIAFLSPFAEFDGSALPEIIGGFILGPVCALEIIVVKIALILIFKSSSSFGTGEVQNFLLSVSYVLPAIMYYRKHRTKKGAAIGLVIGSAASIIVAVFTNIFIIFPVYIYLIGMTWDDIINIFHNVNPYITSIPTIVAFSVVPFNLVSRVATSVITMLVYKKISVPIKKFIS